MNSAVPTSGQRQPSQPCPWSSGFKCHQCHVHSSYGHWMIVLADWWGIVRDRYCSNKAPKPRDEGIHRRNIVHWTIWEAWLDVADLAANVALRSLDRRNAYAKRRPYYYKHLRTGEEVSQSNATLTVSSIMYHAQLCELVNKPMEIWASQWLKNIHCYCSFGFGRNRARDLWRCRSSICDMLPWSCEKDQSLPSALACRSQYAISSALNRHPKSRRLLTQGFKALNLSL